jgi:hypothetical protein
VQRRKGVEEMKIVESWEDNHSNIYAIVQHSEKDQKSYRTKEYEALWMVDEVLNSFGGAVGFGVADFDTIEQAQDFLLKGISEQESNKEIWLDMVEVK